MSIDFNLNVEDLDGKHDFSKLRKFNNYYFAGMPTKQGLRLLKENGVTKIIDFNEPVEGGSESEKMAKELGMEYINIPVYGCQALSLDKVREVNSKINEGEKTLIHCLSGNRVSSWLAVNLYLNHNIEKDKAVEIAKLTGMDKEPVINGTIEVIEKLSKG